MASVPLTSPILPCQHPSCVSGIPADVPLLPSNDHPLREGDVIMAPASIQLFVLETILRDSEGLTYHTGSVLSQSRDILRQGGGGLSSKGDRPCLITDIRRNRLTGVATQYTICLMGSLDSSEEVKDPVLNSFLAPLYPFAGHRDDHVHTSPDWEGKAGGWKQPGTPPAWIVARPIAITDVSWKSLFPGSDLPRWLSRDKKHTFVLHPRDKERFDAILTSKHNCWTNITPLEKRQGANQLSASLIVVSFASLVVNVPSETISEKFIF
ncbi:hypothetical protein DL96DRAFT_1715658 [Flagelloscypha sp. PMI_526]|nr:hypothetical protein DL96DRAFT_1715658 [Flagelloscypha sp. PMI_526]